MCKKLDFFWKTGIQQVKYVRFAVGNILCKSPDRVKALVHKQCLRHTAGLRESNTSTSKSGLPVSNSMTLLRSESSLVQPTDWPFNNHDFCSSADNLHEMEAANWMTSRLYNARMIHWKAAATTTQQTDHITISVYTVSKKNYAKLFFSSELCQISTNCENFWHKDGKKDMLMRGSLIFHLT